MRTRPIADMLRVAVATAIAVLIAGCAIPRGHALTPPQIWDVAAQRFWYGPQEKATALWTGERYA